jgi:octaprenyl-diphosphate synthase
MSLASIPLTELYGTIRDDLEAVRRIFDHEIRSALPFVNELCDTVRSYRGKMLRPALLVLCGKACGGVNDSHHKLAAVVEMVHMATLVHDDVLDQAEQRRQRPTIRSLAGNRAAVLLGDYLISHAFHLCSSLESQRASRRIGATTNIVCEGELLQNHKCHNVALTEEEYFDIVRRKTGALTAVACELGAEYAGADEAMVASLADYGMAAGVAFQIVDDLLDLIGDAGEVGKTLGLDAALGKHTLPTIHCLAHAPIDIANGLRGVIAGEAPGDRRRIMSWLEETGSIEYAFGVAQRHVREALVKLDGLPPSEARDVLTGLAEFITRRRY